MISGMIPPIHSHSLPIITSGGPWVPLGPQGPNRATASTVSLDNRFSIISNSVYKGGPGAPGVIKSPLGGPRVPLGAPGGNKIIQRAAKLRTSHRACPIMIRWADIVRIDRLIAAGVQELILRLNLIQHGETSQVQP